MVCSPKIGQNRMRNGLHKRIQKTKVKEYLISKDSLLKFIPKNNIPKSTLQGWIKTYNKYGPDTFIGSNKRNTLTLQEQNNLVELYLREKTKLTTFTIQRNSLVHLPFFNEREDQFLHARLS